MDDADYRELLTALDLALARLSPRFDEQGFDLEMYEKLRLARETLIRNQRDSQPAAKK